MVRHVLGVVLVLVSVLLVTLGLAALGEAKTGLGVAVLACGFVSAFAAWRHMSDARSVEQESNAG